MATFLSWYATIPSMKVPPKRKGNIHYEQQEGEKLPALNESPSEKEGKFRRGALLRLLVRPSMKVPPKRKGNSLDG